jgi:hypothetical protein
MSSLTGSSALRGEVEGRLKSRTGRWSGDRSSGRILIDTLEAWRQGNNERLPRKVMSGEDVMASSRYPEESPRGLKVQEGIE